MTELLDQLFTLLHTTTVLLLLCTSPRVSFWVTSVGWRYYSHAVWAQTALSCLVVLADSFLGHKHSVVSAAACYSLLSCLACTSCNTPQVARTALPVSQQQATTLMPFTHPSVQRMYMSAGASHRHCYCTALVPPHPASSSPPLNKPSLCLSMQAAAAATHALPASTPQTLQPQHHAAG